MVTREIIRELGLKDFIIFLLQSDYNFEVKKENEITVIIIFLLIPEADTLTTS